MYPWAVCVLVCFYTHACEPMLLQRRVDLCCLFNIAENTTALSHLGKQVIAISIIYSDIQWSRPQTILTNRLTEINAAAHKQADPPPPPPIPLSRLYLFFSPLFSQSSVFFSTLSIIYFLPCPFHFPLSVLSFFVIYFFSFSAKNTNKSLYVSCDFSLTLKAVESWIIISFNHNMNRKNNDYNF